MDWNLVSKAFALQTREAKLGPPNWKQGTVVSVCDLTSRRVEIGGPRGLHGQPVQPAWWDFD